MVWVHKSTLCDWVDIISYSYWFISSKISPPLFRRKVTRTRHCNLSVNVWDMCEKLRVELPQCHCLPDYKNPMNTRNITFWRPLQDRFKGLQEVLKFCFSHLEVFISWLPTCLSHRAPLRWLCPHVAQGLGGTRPEWPPTAYGLSYLGRETNDYKIRLDWYMVECSKSNL